MKKSYLIFLVLSIGMLVVAVVFAGANIGLFVNLPALIVVVFLPCFIVIGVFGFQAFLRSFRLAYIGNDATKEELVTGAAIFSLLGKSLLLTGLITSMIGLITILGNLQTAQEIGKVLAIALITLLYSLILIFLVALPHKHAFDRCIAAAAEDSSGR